MIETLSLKRISLFPRSLRQLVTLSFVLILLPLLVLAWQAWQSLNALSAQAAHINRTTLVDARRSEAMMNASLEMERSYRQYCVLDDPTLAKVYQNQRKRYSEMLDAHAGVLPDEKIWQALSQQLNDLAQLRCKNSSPDVQSGASLEAFAAANSEMVQATRTVVYLAWTTAPAGDCRTRTVFWLAGAGSFSAEPGAGAAVYPDDYRPG